MSRRRPYTTEELERMLENSDFEDETQSSSDDGAQELEGEVLENSDVEDEIVLCFGGGVINDDDDSVEDPDYVPNDLQQFAVSSRVISPVPSLSDVDMPENEHVLPTPSREPSSFSALSPGRISSNDNSNDSEDNAQPLRSGRFESARPTTLDDMKVYDETRGWTYDCQSLSRQDFTNENMIHSQYIPENADIYTIYRLLIDDDAIDLMVEQTNIYGAQTKAAKPNGRMARWKPVDKTEMEKFLGIYLLTGIIRFPTLECYWKKDIVFYYPLMHQIQMSYNRFVAILRCWHFVDNLAERDANNRLYKVKPIIDIIMRNCQKLLTPKDCIVVDESMVPFQGRLLIRQYNPAKTHKYGIKIYKATTDDDYVWKYKVYTGQDPQIDNLDKPGSVIVELCEELLDEGRMIIADNFYTSVPLAEYLLNRN